MNRYVVLFRGINVGTKNRIKMADLKASLADLAQGEIVHYKQSGNLIFNSTLTTVEITTETSKILNHQFDISAPILVRT